MIIIKKNNISKNMFSLLIVLLPFLYQYQGFPPQISLGETLLIPYVLIFVLNMLRKGLDYSNIDITLAAFYITTIFTAMLNMLNAWFSITDASTILMRLFFYAILIYGARSYFMLDNVKKLYLTLTFAFSIYLIIQWFYYYSSGGYLPNCIENDFVFAPETRITDLSVRYMWGFRASSLFLEPSYFSLYVMPAVCIMIFGQEKTAFNKIVLITSVVALVLSTASSGIIGFAIMLGLYLFKINGFKITKNLLFKIMIVVITVLVFVYYIGTESAAVLNSRIATGGSLGQRVLRGLLVYSQLSFDHQLFGVGINNIENYMNAFSISTIFDESNLNYMCTLLQTLNYSGLIGMLSLIVYLVHLKNKAKDSASKALFWLIVFLMCYENILFSYRFAFYLIIYEGIINYLYNECPGKAKLPAQSIRGRCYGVTEPL